MNFDGRDETVHLERGARFGIPANVYHLLAQAAISAQELGGIEPQVLTPHEDGRPDALLFLLGRHLSFFVSVDCSLSPPAVQLSACPPGQSQAFPPTGSFPATRQLFNLAQDCCNDPGHGTDHKSGRAGRV
jgi:hypothetical protein